MLVAEPGGVKEAVDCCDTEVPGFYQVVGGGEGGKGLFKFFEVGGVGQLVGERRGGIEQLAVGY
jgi:hypothetical protein